MITKSIQAAFKKFLKDTKSKMKPIVKIKKEQEGDDEDHENEEFKKRKQQWQVSITSQNNQFNL